MYVFGKTLFFQSRSVTARPLVHAVLKTNQWLGGGERANGYAARQNGRGVWLYKRPLCRRISDVFTQRCIVMATIRRGYTLQFTRRPPWYAVRSEDAQVLCAEVINLLVKGAIEIIPPAHERVKLLQLLLPHLQKRWRPATYSRSQTPESCPGKKVVQDDHFETDPLANMPRGLVHVAGSLKDA